MEVRKILIKETYTLSNSVAGTWGRSVCVVLPAIVGVEVGDILQPLARGSISRSPCVPRLTIVHNGD